MLHVLAACLLKVGFHTQGFFVVQTKFLLFRLGLGLHLHLLVLSFVFARPPLPAVRDRPRQFLIKYLVILSLHDRRFDVEMQPDVFHWIAHASVPDVATEYLKGKRENESSK